MRCLRRTAYPVRRPTDVMPGTLAGDARAAVETGLSARASERVIEAQIESGAHLMSDEWKAFMAIGESFAKHETVKHSSGEYVRDAVHVNSVEGLNSRVRRTNRRRLSSYQPAACRPVFPRDRLPMVAARRHRKRHSQNPAWPGERANPVVARAACAAIDERFSHRHGSSDAPKPARRSLPNPQQSPA